MIEFNRTMLKEFPRKSREIVVLIAYALMFGHAGIGKLAGGSTPKWFLDQFGGTFLNIFDGALNAQFFIIAFVEVLIAIICVVGILRSGKRKELLNVSLILSAMLFIGLSFGQRIIGQYELSATLFFYAMGSVALTYLVERQVES